jgi:hypothetical protein
LALARKREGETELQEICGNCGAFKDYGLGNGIGHCENTDELVNAKNKCCGPKNQGVFFTSKNACLAQKAKTIWEQETDKYIVNIAHSTLVYHAISHVMYQEIFIRNIVKTLEDAQELEAENAIMNQHNIDLEKENVELNKKLVEANKILDELHDLIAPLNIGIADEARDVVERLRVCLTQKVVEAKT